MSVTRHDFIGVTSAAGKGYAMSRFANAQSAPPTTTPAPPRGDDMKRADDLLRQMTIEEKAMQLSCVVPLVVPGRADARPDGQADEGWHRPCREYWAVGATRFICARGEPLGFFDKTEVKTNTEKDEIGDGATR
jgi:hypothetical protein